MSCGRCDSDLLLTDTLKTSLSFYLVTNVCTTNAVKLSLALICGWILFDGDEQQVSDTAYGHPAVYVRAYRKQVLSFASYMCFFCVFVSEIRIAAVSVAIRVSRALR
jgi:hypothetical protein